MKARPASLAVCLALAATLGALPAGAVLDVENRGPQLTAGAYAMRITNIGAIGNPYRDVGRSFDPSFEYPRGSGQELLKHAELWVGAVNERRETHVSGGPLLEWRPTLEADDRVHVAYARGAGTTRFVDDDGDGRTDEEWLDGKDDDGDGEVDEDLGFSASQNLFARYSDDQPEAVNYTYPTGETHVPLHLDVKQAAFAFATPGYDRVAGLRFTITNKGHESLRDVWVGLYADLDARAAGQAGGHLDDIVVPGNYTRVFHDGYTIVSNLFIDRGPPPTPYAKDCFATETGAFPIIADVRRGANIPAAALLGLGHSIDPLAQLIETQRLTVYDRIYTFAPAHRNFVTSLFANDLPPGQGGGPILDVDRYRALRGLYPRVPDTTQTHDYVVLVSAGPFRELVPGRSVDVDFAFVCGPNADSVRTAMGHAVAAHRGPWLNLLPDTVFTSLGDWGAGKSGITGHETCIEPPVGLTFTVDPHCARKYAGLVGAAERYEDYEHGRCVWTDADCDLCTGFNGNETQATWSDPAVVPPPPSFRAIAGDGSVTIEWDDLSEVLVSAGAVGSAGTTFSGYNVFRLDDWRGRSSELPSPTRFQAVASFGRDSAFGAQPLAAVTDTTVPYDRILYERKVHPIGRYRWVDRNVTDGFDYVYVVTAVSQRAVTVVQGSTVIERLESPLVTNLDSLVTPHVGASPTLGRVWVVPNPYRAHAAWDRTPVAGDAFSRHLDFFGLPLARSTIRIWTLSGDLVAQIEHDGTRGNGEERWNLISRNGQDVTSGVYVFTVASAAGNATGKFVVMR